ncbi:histidine phosphatase family protein [Humitalea sp. 24SJ18S-53]|uniref:histidine phosphatase family protein n=1 Tax=Humitalea sp. 24SJ18S-53 TaxID=3422307 RepID=UPI003D671A32
MSRRVHLITHPDVLIDPAVPVPDWGLSPRGVLRTQAMLARPWVEGIGAVFSSAERKATQTAGILAMHLGLPVGIDAGLGENDRSATGYLPKVEFEAMADAFFARPGEQVSGWEAALAAQARMLAAVDRVLLAVPPGGDVAIIAHGGVGTLLLCHLRGVAISRALDQPGTGGGNRFVFTDPGRLVLSAWQPIET